MNLSHFTFDGLFSLLLLLESYIEWCPSNEVLSNETCESTCDHPDTCISPPAGVGERCVCTGDYKILNDVCIPQEQCGCFVVDKRAVIMVSILFAFVTPSAVMLLLISIDCDSDDMLTATKQSYYITALLKLMILINFMKATTGTIDDDLFEIHGMRYR